jgi:hypothetical protein
MLATNCHVGLDSSVGIATRYRLDGPGIESQQGEISPPVQTGPGAHPDTYTTGIQYFTGVKRPGRGVDHPPPSSAEVKERVELYVCSPCGPSWPVIGWPLPLYFTKDLTDSYGTYLANRLRTRQLSAYSDQTYDKITRESGIDSQEGWGCYFWNRYSHGSETLHPLFRQTQWNVNFTYSTHITRVYATSESRYLRHHDD